ncbi:hypothetical protein [Hymenobacter armeniacus]|uniref:DUF1682 domain-containing protein n=1 Tax=Hymenobacter armeniacus TaxID=2771358 RepID=A0ABR8JU44_9BACT|nr:hypothetical protein [Hymenobacter armeniacus]MBD2721469.1 hypothetical protein [Hymenobacter armeniacus]
MDRKFWLLRGLRFFFFAALFVAVVTLATQALWNWLMPSLFHLPVISLAQTLGLLALSRILFGFRGGRPGGWAAKRRAWKQRMAGRMEHLSPDAREKFRQEMRARCTMGWMGRSETATADTAARQPA